MSARTSNGPAVALAGRRLRSAWRLLLPAWFGILLAVVLLGTVPLYTLLVTDVQLAATVNRQGAIGRNIAVVASIGQVPGPGASGSVTGISMDALRQEGALVSQAGAHDIAGFTQHAPTHYLIANPITINSIGTRSLDIHAAGTPQATLERWDFSQVGPHMQVLTGALPHAAASGPPEAMITTQMAQIEGVHVGDLITAVQYYPYNLAYKRVFTLRVAGVWQPQHPDEGFWNGRSFVSIPACDLCPFIYPVLLDHTAFETLLDNAPGFSITQFWVFYGVPHDITAGNYTRVIASMGQFRSQVGRELSGLATSVQVLGNLDQALRELQRQLALLGLPLNIVIAQLVGLPLLFVMFMGVLVVEAQAPELATLARRGASRIQLVSGYGGQIIPLAVLAVLRGIWPARLLALGLVRWATPAATLAAAQVSEADLARLATIQRVVLLAVAGALLGVAALVVAMLAAARVDALSLRRTQAGFARSSLWRRLNLDIGLAVICLLAYLDLVQFGGLAARQQTAQTTPGLLLLVAPSLLLLGGTLLLLRLVPLAARLACWRSRRSSVAGPRRLAVCCCSRLRWASGCSLSPSMPRSARMPPPGPHTRPGRPAPDRERHADSLERSGTRTGGGASRRSGGDTGLPRTDRSAADQRPDRDRRGRAAGRRSGELAADS